MQLSESSPEMQAGFETLSRLLIDDWVRRIMEFAPNHQPPISEPYHLAAGSIVDTFQNGRHLKKLPERLRDFVKQAIKHSLRLVASVSTRNRGEYVSHGAFIPDMPYPRQPEIYLYFDNGIFKSNLEGIRVGNHIAIRNLLMSREPTLKHELRHAYDDYASGGKYRQSPQTKKADFDKKMARHNPSPENVDIATQSYLMQPHEINARFTQTVAAIRPYIQGTWQDYLYYFKTNLLGWRELPSDTKRRLIKRLAMQWTDVHGRKPIDITPFIQKLNDKMQPLSKDIRVYPAHGNIEVTGLHNASPRAQAAVLSQATYLGDIFRRQVITNDDVPMLKGFEFVANKGRNVDYRISARYRRGPKPRRV